MKLRFISIVVFIRFSLRMFNKTVIVIPKIDSKKTYRRAETDNNHSHRSLVRLTTFAGTTVLFERKNNNREKRRKKKNIIPLVASFEILQSMAIVIK